MTPLTTQTRNAMPLARRDLLGSLFDDFFNDSLLRPDWLPPAFNATGLPAVTRARMDVIDKGNAFEIAVDLPGVKKEDIEVEVEGDRVSISAETKAEKEEKDGDRLLYTERTAASYARSFALPAEVTDAGAQAAYENGVLRLTLPKRTPTAGHRLSIK